ncbi:hypothetical protein V8D89_004964 [Ganoderma adspersum]
MNACPNEILNLISAEACTDDGLTGRSLSSVSRRIRDTSRRYAFQSIALYGTHQLSSFASVLEKADPESRAVRHLYLTDRRRIWMECLPDQGADRDLPQEICVHDANPPLEYSSSPILRILKTVAPTVQTLTLLLFDRYDEQPLSDAISFPRLRELTVHGSSLTHTTWHGSSLTYTPSELPQCLSLRRLHVIFALGRSWTTAVSRLAPHLTHLRISRLIPSHMSLIDIVRSLERPPPQDSPASGTGFPPTLERVLVQLLQNRRLHTQNQSTKSVQSERALLVTPMGSYLKNVAMRDVRRRIVLLKPGSASAHMPELLTGENADVQFYAGIKAAWQQRVGGSESAVWDVEPLLVLASYGYWTGGK